ncbi:MAG: sulfatase [Halobacteriaceae archaeon]
MPDRPNVLLVVTDQQFAGAMGCANDDLATPAMDGLADRGTRFPNAYCPYPLCTPARASLLTGRPPHEVGVMENNQHIDDEYLADGLGRVFAAAGYDCGYAGKFHVPDIALPAENDHGFERLCGFDDHAVPEACAEFVERDRGAPFLLVASFDNPHNICEWARGQPLPWGPIEEPPVAECPTLPANFHPPAFEPGVIREQEADPDRAYVAFHGDPADWRRYRNAYYRLVERVDRRVGRVLNALDAAGEREDTVVVFLSDHGDGHGAHRLNQKSYLYEEQTRVPLLVDAPDGGGGRVDDRLVAAGLDLLPTLADYAGIDVERRGRSLRPAVAGDDADGRESVVVQTATPVPGRMVRTERYKYVVYARGQRREQLFDLRADPGEMVDLADDAAHAGVLEDHRERLLEWCLETGDCFEEHYAHPGLPTIPGYEYADLQ